MIKSVLTFLLKTIMILAVFVLPSGVAGYFETHYTRDALVTSVNGNTVLAVDTTDNIWCFESAGFRKGDSVTLKMFTNYTDSIITDDEVINVKLNNR